MAVFRKRPVPPALLADQLLPLLGQGIWTDYGKELCRRLEAILTHDL